jgi:hypothetical protein
MSDSEELMQDQDRIDAYKQLLERAHSHGFACVNELIDAYEEQGREKPQA